MTSVAGHMQSEIVIILVLVIRTYSAKNFWPQVEIGSGIPRSGAQNGGTEVTMYYIRYHIQQLLYYIRTL